MAQTGARATDPAYLRYQYADSEKLRIRAETHRLYSERQDDFAAWVLGHVAPASGQALLDVGCGHGAYHAALCASGVRIVGVDASLGMVREARRHALDGGLVVSVAQGSAEAIPLRDGAFDRVLAAHMLYHVPDQARALRELRRVLRPGGRVVLVTNIAQPSPRMLEIHTSAARQLGLGATDRIDARFSMDELPLVRSVFPDAQRHVREDAFIFPTSDAVMRYYATGFADAVTPRPAGDSHRPTLMRLVEQAVEAIIDREGALRDPKGGGCFVADL